MYNLMHAPASQVRNRMQNNILKKLLSHILIVTNVDHNNDTYLVDW